MYTHNHTHAHAPHAHSYNIIHTLRAHTQPHSHASTYTQHIIKTKYKLCSPLSIAVRILFVFQ